MGMPYQSRVAPWPSSRTSKSFRRLPAAMPVLATIHFFWKLTWVVSAVIGAAAGVTLRMGKLTADGMYGVTRSTDLMPLEMDDWGLSRGSSGRVLVSYGVPASDSSGEVLVVGVCESEGIVNATDV